MSIRHGDKKYIGVIASYHDNINKMSRRAAKNVIRT